MLFMLRRRAESRSRGRLATRVLTLALLLSPAFSGTLLYICSADGQVRLSCCCPHEHGASPGTSIAPPGCCQVRTVERTPTGAVSSLAGNTASPPFALATAPSASHAPSPAPQAMAVSWRGPPHHAPPSLFVRNCSFLI